MDYNEIICTAIDTIVSSRLEGLQFDITKLCIIEDDSKAKEGQYIVSDGSAARFQAFSSDDTLKKGNQVQVTIPNGDYTKQKIIKGKVITSESTPFKFTSPLDTMVKITDNIFNGVSNISLLANENSTSADGSPLLGTIKEVHSITDPAGFSGFTRLGVQADFSAMLAKQDVISGTYGINFKIYTEIGTVYDLSLTTKDMFGNPYSFDGFITQEKVFSLEGINTIKAIDVYFFQNSDFKNSAGELIPYRGKGFGDELGEKLPDNIFADNIKIFLGYDMREFTEENLRLFTSENLTYKYDNDIILRNLNLRWMHKINEGEFEILNDDDLGTEEFEVFWYQYDEEYKDKNDEYAGFGWKRIKSNFEEGQVGKEEEGDFNAEEEQLSQFKCRAYLDHLKQKEEFKAVGIWRPNYEEVDPDMGKMVFTSPVLTFVNEIKQADQTTKNAVSALQIICEDGSEGNYFIYNQNGKINNEGDGSSRERTFVAKYKGGPITNDLGKIDYLKWWLPADKTMIVSTEAWNTDKDGVVETDVSSANVVKYNIITREPAADGNLNSDYQKYAIKNQWNQSNANNTIKCVLSVDGVEYEAIEELKFGKAGTNGTNLTLVLQFEDGQNAVLAKKDTQTRVSAELYDSNGRNLGFTKKDKLKWSWYRPKEEEKYQYIQIIEEEDNPASVSLKFLKEDYIVPMDNYYILQVEYVNENSDAYTETEEGEKKEDQYKGQTLTSYLPIPIKIAELAHIEGATEVIYNSQGLPSYYSDPYVLYIMHEGLEKEIPLDKFFKEDVILTPEQIEKFKEYEEGKNIEEYLDEQNKIKSEYLNTVAQILRAIDKYADYESIPCEWGLSHTDDLRKKQVKKDEEGNIVYDGNDNIVYEYVEDEEGKSLFDGLTLGYVPTLKKLKDGQVALCASSFYSTGYNNEVCVYAWGEDEEAPVTLWAQPILIHQSQYDFSMLNQWDGQLTIDEKNGTIMSKMLGAGKKNLDNTFSGVLIGDVQGGTMNTSATDSATGVYGMHHGEWSFGLRDDGTAFFGKADRGQIRLDGNESTIRSASFEEEKGTGMNIDLDDGIFQIQVNGKDRVFISPGFNSSEKKDDIPYFQIASKTLIDPSKEDSKTYNLIYMDEDKYYLQSDKYSENNGMKIDLANGSIQMSKQIEVETESGEIRFDKEGSVLIQPHTPFFEVQKGNKSLIYMGSDDGYYLQSFDYVQHGNGQAENNLGESVYLDGTINEKRYITKVNGIFYLNELIDGEYWKGDKHPCHTKAVLTTDSDYDAALKEWQATPDKGEPTYEAIKAIVLKQRFNKVDNAKSVVLAQKGSGIRLDLNNGTINGYNLYLKANNKDKPEARYVLIDGNADSPTDTSSGGWPFMIGTNFKVDWDGHLTCNNIEYLGAGNQSVGGTHININDRFLVNYDGSGTWWSGSVGYASRAKIAESLEGSAMAEIKKLVTGLEQRFNSHVHYTGLVPGNSGTPIII